MINLLEFVQNRERGKLFFENFEFKDIKKVVDLITAYFVSNIGEIDVMPGMENVSQSGETLLGVRWLKTDGTSVRLNWTTDISTGVYSIDFFSTADELFNGSGKTDFTIYTNGASVAVILPIVVEIMTSGNFSVSSDLAKKLMASTLEEGLSYRMGNVKYFFEALSPDEREEMKKRKNKLQNIIYTRKETDREDFEDLKAEFAAINKALRQDTAIVTNVDLKFKKGVATRTILSDEEQAAQDKIDDETDDPKAAFEDMDNYLQMVIDGIQNSLLLCGAPGIGKTFRVNKKLKQNGYTYKTEQNASGNMMLIKGKATPLAFYTVLYEMRDKGNIVVIDDADSVIGPKAPEDIINILKAATDSSDVRTVSYRTSKDLFDSDGNSMPKSFDFNGAVIIITNYRAGQVDTAIRNRAFLMDMNFSTESLLKIIKELLPHIEPETLTAQAKINAYDYLEQLVKEGADMEISIRSFIIVAKIYSMPNLKPEAYERMVRTQMKLQFARGGKKY
jgi:hypothetical protein